ncbi:hypothetical protein ACFLUV_06960 [Elusimicrobiota bacterium]
MKIKDKNKGAVLFMVIIFSIILSVAGMAYLYMSQSERIFVRQQVNMSKSFYLAEAGYERAKAWLMINFHKYSNAAAPFDPFGGVQTLPSGSYKITVRPDPGNPGSVEKLYVISSTGTSGNIDKPLESEVKIYNFAKFAYFSDKEKAGGAVNIASADYYDRIWFTDYDWYQGPVHSNDEISINGKPAFSVDAGGDFEISSSTGFYYRFVDTSINGATRSALEGAGGNVLTGQLELGSTTYPVVPYINMYKNWNLQRLETAANDDGLYLDGDYAIEVTDDDVDYGASWTIDGSSVVFVNGDITIKSQAGFTLDVFLTIAASGTITIIDDINADTAGGGMLGLVAGGDIMTDNTSPDNLDVDAIMMTYGSFYDSEAESRASSSPHEAQQATMTITGGIIQDTRQPFGVAFDTVALPSGSGSELQGLETGYKKLPFTYDARVKDTPPPYFPVYIVEEPVYWEEKPTIRK